MGSEMCIRDRGDLRAQEILHSHNTIVRQQVADHGGFEVKSMEDGFMLAFSSRKGICDPR